MIALAAVALPAVEGVSLAQNESSASEGIGPVKALVLGDSMSLCGFGDTLSRMLQASGLFDEVHIYMASGTNPLSWLSLRSYQRAGTRSGFWEIHDTAEGREQSKDVYGMRPGYAPGYHIVPKLETLLNKYQPDVLIVQLGSNLYDLFPTKTIVGKDGKRIRQKYVTPAGLSALPAYLKPFRDAVLANGSGLKHCCWIAPPESGSVHPELADALCQALKEQLAPAFDVFDSRSITSYPYKNMGSDGIHFWGAEADLWGADTFCYLESTVPQKHELPSLPTVRQMAEAVTLSLAASAEPSDAVAPVAMTLLLRHRPEIIPIESMHPYRNQIAVYDYEILSQSSGSTAPGGKIRVVHPVVLDLTRTESANRAVGSALRGDFVPFDPTSSAATWTRSDDYDFATLSEENVREYISTADLKLIEAVQSEEGLPEKKVTNVARP